MRCISTRPELGSSGLRKMADSIISSNWAMATGSAVDHVAVAHGLELGADFTPIGDELLEGDTHCAIQCCVAGLVYRSDDCAAKIQRTQPLSKLRRPSSTATEMVSPLTNRPCRISRANGFSSNCWIARFKGRAP